MSDIKFGDFHEFETLEKAENWIKTHPLPRDKSYFHSSTKGVCRMDSTWHIICGWNYGPRGHGHGYYKYFICRTLCDDMQEWHIFCTATPEDTEKTSQQLEQWLNNGMYNVTLQDDDDDFVV